MFVQASTCLFLALALVDANDAGGLDMPFEPCRSTQDGLCLQCEDLFSKLEDAPDGELQQHSQLQLRGEPKSGTTFMCDWGKNILEHTCEHLRGMYGSKSCRTAQIDQEEKHLAMIFEPSLAEGDASCACTKIERVDISFSCLDKHTLPVNEYCPWSHAYGIAGTRDGCWSIAGQPVENESDLWTCMQETPCDITDNRLQVVPMRDPRAVAVSTHFHRVWSSKKYVENHHSVDGAVLGMLPQLCHLTTLRHIMFEGLLSDRSEVFWYEEAVEDPFDWHYRWASFAGLILPAGWVDGMVTTVQEQRKFNPHPGGEKNTAERTWRDEVSPETRQEMDSVLRKWLPGVLLSRFGVSS
ncbi:unnamed protein product [Ectocarpus sp. 12 AP-2014]